MISKKEIKQRHFNLHKDLNEIKMKENEDMYNDLLLDLKRYINGEYNDAILKKVDCFPDEDYCVRMDQYIKIYDRISVVNRLNKFVKDNKDKFGNNQINIYIAKNYIDKEDETDYIWIKIKTTGFDVDE